MQSMQSLPCSLWGFVAALFLVTVGHEAGHFLMAKLLGISVRRISIGVGPALSRCLLAEGIELVLRPLPISVSVGVTGRREPDGRPRRPLGHDMLMAAGGPAVSVLISLCLLALAAILAQLGVFRPWFLVTAVLSLVMGLCSLVPIPGLDGGHLLVLSAARLGHELSPQSERFAHQLGMRCLAGLCVVVMVVNVVGAV